MTVSYGSDPYVGAYAEARLAARDADRSRMLDTQIAREPIPEDWIPTCARGHVETKKTLRATGGEGGKPKWYCAVCNARRQREARRSA